MADNSDTDSNDEQTSCSSPRRFRPFPRPVAHSTSCDSLHLNESMDPLNNSVKCLGTSESDIRSDSVSEHAYPSVGGVQKHLRKRLETSAWRAKHVGMQVVECKAASAMTERDIQDLFGEVDYQASNDLVPGETYNEILQNLINEIKSANIGFPVTSVEELEQYRNKWLHIDMKNVTDQQLHLYERVLRTVSEEVADKPKNRKEFFQHMTKAVKAVMIGERESGFLSRLRHLAAFSVEQCDKDFEQKTDDDNARMQLCWNRFLSAILCTFCCAVHVCRDGEKTYSIDTTIGYKGDVTQTLPMIPRLSTEKVTYERHITSKPDAVLFGSLCPENDLDQGLPILTCEMNTEHAQNERRDASDTETDGDDVPSGLNYGRTKQISTQHFCQLLGSLRAAHTETSLDTVFGLYAVKNKVHLTRLGLNAEIKRGRCKSQMDAFLSSTCSQTFHAYNSGTATIPNSVIKFQLNNFGYMDLFNYEHFRAFISMIQYLQYMHIHAHGELSGLIIDEPDYMETP